MKNEKDERRWALPDIERMIKFAWKYLKIDRYNCKNIFQDFRLIYILNYPPICISKLCDIMEIRHEEFRKTDITLKDLIIKHYGEEAFNFVLEYAGLMQK